MSIYVEILIRGSIEDIWEKTQQPKLHQRWDVRFSEIDYLPRQPGEPQRFRYSTRIGMGLRIAGEGESIGERDDLSGKRTSALKFWSRDVKSLIEFGSGYWQYVPGDRGVRFLTLYDYRTRFGVLGRIIDRMFFRPLIGWATAWSFDRLRLWVEEEVTPEVSRNGALIYCVTRLALASIWLYQGLVPKLLYHSPDEWGMLRDAGVAEPWLLTAMSWFGWLEICLGLMFVIFWSARWPLWFTAAAMCVATAAVGINSPEYLHAAFNPIALNLAVAALAISGLLAASNLPSAKKCRRRPLVAER